MTIVGVKSGPCFPSHFCPEVHTFLYYKSSTKCPHLTVRSERHAEAENRSCVVLLCGGVLLFERILSRWWHNQGQSYPEAERKMSYKSLLAVQTTVYIVWVVLFNVAGVVSLELVMGLGEGKGVAALNMYDGG